MLIQPIDYFLVVWFALAGLSALYVGWDQYRNNPEPVVMKWGFILVTLYTGPLGLLLYVLADKEPRPGEHEEFIRPLWKQAVGSTVHCAAGDATGIIVAAVIVASLGMPMWLDLIIEYVAGFAFGLFIFQALFMKRVMGGSYWENVRKSFLPEFVSMNFMMAGMGPVMSFLMMGRDMRAMVPTELLFWGVMSLGVIVGFSLAVPANAWLVARRLKHGLMTVRASDASEIEHGQRAGAGTTAGHVSAHHHAAESPTQDADKAAATGNGRGPKDGAAGKDHAHHDRVTIPSLAAIGRHPIHPMLVPIPIGLLFGALVTDVAFLATDDPSWANASALLIAGGLLGGVAAAIPRLIDVFGRPAIRELRHARYHLIGNVAMLAIAAISLVSRLASGPVEAALPWGFTLSVITVGLLVFTGWHGGEMVFGHGVGATPHAHGEHQAAGAGRRGHPQAAVSASSRSAVHGGHGNSGSTANANHSGHGMKTDATRAQLAAVGGVSFFILLVGLVAPANWVNMGLSAREVGGAIMPPGMVMDRDTPAEAMLDMAAIHPRLVTARYGLDTRGDTVLEPRVEEGVKIFDLSTSVVRWTILPGITVDAFAFNGQVPGPRLVITEGDRVRIDVTNNLPESTTVHWHGLILPNAMDGPAEVTQAPIETGQAYSYEFVALQSGTFFYHSHDHVDRQQALGLYGALIIEPATPEPLLEADHEVVVQLQEWLLREGLTFPAMPMDGGQPNYFTINGRAYPATDRVQMRVGETLKVRFIGSNNGFINPMHVHGGPFLVVARDGITLPEPARFEADTINVGPGQRFDVIWTALNPGLWLIHCHIGHHTTNNNTETDGGGGLMMVVEVI